MYVVSFRLSFGIPFGDKSFTRIRTTSNGLITLGRSRRSVGSLYRPYSDALTESSLAFLAPFWDDFHPAQDNDGRVYYKVGAVQYVSYVKKALSVLLC